jgi:hypothetical protein
VIWAEDTWLPGATKLIGRWWVREASALKGQKRLAHCTAALAVFLVVNVETDCVGLLELEEGSVVREDGAVFKESDVLSAKLHGACSGSGGGHGVFSQPQEEKESKSE